MPVPASETGGDFAPTGITELDALAEVIASGNQAAINDAVLLTVIPCANVEGLGGPPPCPEGVAEGTGLAVLPVLESHLTFTDTLRLDVGPLLAAYEAPDVTTSVYAFPELEVDWPVASYVMVYPHTTMPAAVTLLVTADGEIMRVIYHFGAAEDAIPEGVSLLYRAGE